MIKTHTHTQKKNKNKNKNKTYFCSIDQFYEVCFFKVWSKVSIWPFHNTNPFNVFLNTFIIGKCWTFIFVYCLKTFKWRTWETRKYHSDEAYYRVMLCVPLVSILYGNKKVYITWLDNYCHISKLITGMLQEFPKPTLLSLRSWPPVPNSDDLRHFLSTVRIMLTVQVGPLI